MFEEVFLDPRYVKKPPLWKRIRFWLVIFLSLTLTGMSVAGVQAVTLAQRVYPEKDAFEVLGSFGQLAMAGDRELAEESGGVINVLLLGVGGNGYYGNIITDTILILSVKLGNNADEPTRVSLLSIPRDLAILLDEDPQWHKINEVYKSGELQQAGLGHSKLREVLYEWTGIDTPYYSVIDFKGFRQAIDAVGGVDITVDRGFNDFSYPDYQHGYLSEVAFVQGPQHLDGERALQFARSRHGNNGEGSDFARIRRQHKILGALKEKVAALNPFFDWGKAYQFFSEITGHLTTNLEPWQIKRLYDLGRGVAPKDIVSKSLDPRTGLVCSEIDGETKLYLIRLCPGKTLEDVAVFAAGRFER